MIEGWTEGLRFGYLVSASGWIEMVEWAVLWVSSFHGVLRSVMITDILRF
jgi:hypothetical protein